MLGLFPVLVILVGSLYVQAELWTNPSSEADLLRALDAVLGDVRM